MASRRSKLPPSLHIDPTNVEQDKEDLSIRKQQTGTDTISKRRKHHYGKQNSTVGDSGDRVYSIL